MTFILPSIGGGIIASPTAPPAPPYSNTYSALLDGTDDAIETTYSPTVGSTAFTATMWIKSSNTTTSQGFISNYNGSSYNLNVISPYTTKSFYVIINNGTSQSVINGIGGQDSTLDLRDGNWHHLAITVNGTSVKIYKDGGDAAINTSNPTNTQGTPFATWTSGTSYIGKAQNFWFGTNGSLSYGSGNRYYLDGNIDEAAVWESELSGSDISAIYNSGLPNDISSYSPVGWWRMGDNDSGTGTTITDQGSGGNDATLDNGAAFSTDVPLAPLVLPSITNTYSVDFDGTNDYMDFGTNTTINSSSAFSVSAWFNVDNISSFPAICLLKTNQSNGFIIALSNTTGANQIYNGVWFGSAPTGDTNQIKGFATGNTTLATALSSGWHHLVFTYDGLDTQSASSSTVYIDGVEYTSSQAVGLPSYSNVNYVAKGGANFNGLIDEFAIFNTELTQREVTGIYNSGTPNDISSLNPVGWWRMGDNNSGSGTTITDQGSGGNDGTLTNGPTFSTTVP